MFAPTEIAPVDWEAFARARAGLGANFVRILGYFREDGVKSVSEIEQAVRAQHAAALVLPAHTLKGEARQFGAEPLADLAETIENIARSCVETHEPPREAIEHAARLRPLFEATLGALERAATPLVERRGGFGRKASAGAAFGQVRN